MADRSRGATLNRDATLRTFLAIVVLFLAAAGGPAAAADYAVKLQSRGTAGAFVFEPMILRIAPGDMVTFIPVDKGHAASQIGGLAPAGAIAWQGKLNRPVTVTFRQEGVYGVRCAAHYSLGMAGMIIVGDPGPNLAAARTYDLPKMVRARIGAALAALE